VPETPETRRELEEAWRGVEGNRFDDPFARRGLIRLAKALLAFHAEEN